MVKHKAVYLGAIGGAGAIISKSIKKSDLVAYEVKTHAPLLGRYRNLELAFSPGATGGVTALETLNILAAFPSDQVGWDSARGLHLRAEAVRFAFQDRLRYLGDPDHVDAPWSALASAAYGGAVAGCIRPRGPRSPKAAPDPWRFEATRRHAADTSTAPGPSGDCTTHIGAVDRQRNLVSLTHTAVSLFGLGVSPWTLAALVVALRRGVRPRAVAGGQAELPPGPGPLEPQMPVALSPAEAREFLDSLPRDHPLRTR